MSSAPQKDFISWERFSQDVDHLADKLKDYSFNKIVAVARGGLAPALLLSQKFNIRDIDTICLSSYGEDLQQKSLDIIKSLESDKSDILIIDDLVDTGATFLFCSKVLPNAVKASVYAKPKGISSVDVYARDMTQDTWLVFPWEES